MLAIVGRYDDVWMERPPTHTGRKLGSLRLDLTVTLDRMRTQPRAAVFFLVVNHRHLLRDVATRVLCLPGSRTPVAEDTAAFRSYVAELAAAAARDVESLVAQHLMTGENIEVVAVELAVLAAWAKS